MPDTYEDCLAIALSELRVAYATITDEIATYPTPVSGCDAQYTHLLSDRSRIADALSALETRPFVATPRIMSPGARVESR